MNGPDDKRSFDFYYLSVSGGRAGGCSFLEVGKEFHGYYLDVVNFIFLLQLL